MRFCKERWVDVDSRRRDGKPKQQHQQVHFEIFFSQLYDRVPYDHVVKKTREPAHPACAIGDGQHQQQQWHAMYTTELAIA
jgi:hypothetical protein